MKDDKHLQIYLQLSFMNFLANFSGHKRATYGFASLFGRSKIQVSKQSITNTLRENVVRLELIQKEKSKFEKYSYFTKEEQHDQETIVPLLYLICC